MKKITINVLKKYKKVNCIKVSEELNIALSKLKRKIVVLDDDPTGVQTVNDVSVYTEWSRKALMSAFNERKNIFFILTNSRSLTKEETINVHEKIGSLLPDIANKTSKDYILISRGDSTLRGHYPIETEILRNSIEKNSEKRFDGEILIPFLKEGGRYTIDNIHYVKEGKFLVPVGETEFSKDKSFGFRNSNLGKYVEEKTNGKYPKESCIYISLQDIRNKNIEKITKQLQEVNNFNKVIVNAIDYTDLKIFFIAYIKTVLEYNKEFIFRGAAAIPKILGGIKSVPLLSKENLMHNDSKVGGIILVGSHVNKTTQQLEELRYCKNKPVFIEYNQHLVMIKGGLRNESERVLKEAEKHLKKGRNVVVYTRRDRFDLCTDDEDKQLKISVKISTALSSIIGKLSVRPSFIITKGGNTSYDVGVNALKVKKATIMGQIETGIPVWLTGDESIFPKMPYILFPGNVGEKDTLKKVLEKLIRLGSA